MKNNLGGLTNHHRSEYNSFVSMKRRCYDPSHQAWKWYGGRGIKVAPVFMRTDGFKHFFLLLGEKPSPQHTLDRVDPDRDYEPSNLRWANPIEQSRNKRPSKRITGDFTIQGQLFSTKSQAAEYFGIDIRAVSRREGRGWSLEKALTTPMYKHGANQYVK